MAEHQRSHAVLGAGGVGGLVAASLARAGRDVALIVRDPSHPALIHVESAVMGDFDAKVRPVERLDGPVDFLWIAVKAPQLRKAVLSAPPDLVRCSAIPLLNGVDHIPVLVAAYENLTIGAMGVESERRAPGRIVQPQPFLWVHLAGPFAQEACSELNAAEIPCTVKADGQSVLWQKLVMLAPLALTTTALQAPLGEVRSAPGWNERLMAAVDEAAAVASSVGAEVDADFTKSALSAAPGSFRSSMQKDRAAGRELELEQIAGPVRREGRAHGVATPVFDELWDALEPVASGAPRAG